MKTESETVTDALRAYLHFWHRFRKEVAEDTISATSRIHWPRVGDPFVIVCDFASKEDALKRAATTIIEIELQLYLRG